MAHGQSLTAASAIHIETVYPARDGDGLHNINIFSQASFCMITSDHTAAEAIANWYALKPLI